MLLAKNTPPDRMKAAGYIEQAMGAIEESSQEDVSPPPSTAMFFSLKRSPDISNG